MELRVFDEIAEYVRAMVPDELGELRLRSHRRGVKIWFDTDKAPKEHYEAQLLARRHVDGKSGMAVEVGFHSEHPSRERNEDVVAGLIEVEHEWRDQLGGDAEAGLFFGADNWTRLSEAWIEPDVDDREFAFEVASRTVDYLTVIEPIRRRIG